jgi:hypothetical protein
VVAFGIAAMAIGIGVVFIFLGLTVMSLVPKEERVPEEVPA